MRFIDVRRQRLQALKEDRPQYAELFAFYEQLYNYFAAQDQAFLTVARQAEPTAERHRQGLPLIGGADLEVQQEPLCRFLQGLVGLMRDHGTQGQDDLEVLQAALAGGRLDGAALLRACLLRQRGELVEATRQDGVVPVLTEYVLQMALSYALQRAREEGLHGDSAGWEHGFCPLCGSLPAMGELYGDDGKRRLHCATCATVWDFPRLRCTFCGNDDPDQLEYFTAEGEGAYRVDVCRQCSCYLKTVDSRQTGSALPMDMEDIATVHLDLLAQREGFTRGKSGGEG
jgi:FdhE protein